MAKYLGREEVTEGQLDYLNDDFFGDGKITRKSKNDKP